MRADSALSHLYEDEECVVTLMDGSQRTARWNRRDWCFLHAGPDGLVALDFDEIKEWRPASIRF
ncbi:MAG TPA: hypothetical protein VIM12_11865 [Noviherbaspirillum sp.]|uniref:hypothetical protein n=1 Tax=Noviherbaspirillum sp. TaxID=1926288 RepID=UPI002F9243DD